MGKFCQLVQYKDTTLTIFYKKQKKKFEDFKFLLLTSYKRVFPENFRSFHTLGVLPYFYFFQDNSHGYKLCPI